MSEDNGLHYAISGGQRVLNDLVGLGVAGNNPATWGPADDGESDRLRSAHELLTDYDRRIRNLEIRAATRSRFESGHYADAVEAGVKALNERIRARTGRAEDGDSLMTLVFSPTKPLLRINKLSSKAHESTQRGHMQLCQGVVAAWRNPRAHALTDDDPVRCLMMLETIADLIETTNRAVRTRRHR